jgi:hypothetical protein
MRLDCILQSGCANMTYSEVVEEKKQRKVWVSSSNMKISFVPIVRVSSSPLGSLTRHWSKLGATGGASPRHAAAHASTNLHRATAHLRCRRGEDDTHHITLNGNFYKYFSLLKIYL